MRSIDYDLRDLGVGFVPDWDGDPARPYTDAAGPIMAALDFIRQDRGGRGGGILWIDGWAYLAQSIVTRHQGIEIRGTGAGYAAQNLASVWKPGTQLVAAPGVTAFRVRGMTDTDGAPPNPNLDSSFFMRIHDLTIVSAGGGAGHGMHISAPISVERCFLQGFGGDGIHIFADPSNGGTAGGWNVERTTIGACGGWGMNVEGGDADVGRATLVNCSGNHAGGFRDWSFGNAYDACHAAGNGPDPADASTWCDYRTSGAPGEPQNNASVFTHCYTEAGLSQVWAPALIQGGQLSGRNAGNARCYNGAVELGRPYEHLRAAALARNNLRTQFGARADDAIVFGWSFPDHPSSDHTELEAELDAAGDWNGWVTLRNAGSSSRPYISFPGSALRIDGSMSGELPPMTSAPRYQEGIQFGYPSNRVRHFAAASPPEDPDLPNGSICWNTGPGPLCWRRLGGAWEAWP